jgi:hypothetical protein
MFSSFRRPSSFRSSVLAGTAIFSLWGFAAGAASPGAGDPTTVHTSTAAGQAAPPSGPGHKQESMIEQRIADLRAKLQITPAESAQWEQFAQVMRDNARSIDAAFDRRVQTLPGLSAPENMQSYAALALEHAQEVQKLVPAFQGLYDTLSDSQKRLADQVFREDTDHRERARHG